MRMNDKCESELLNTDKTDCTDKDRCFPPIKSMPIDSICFVWMLSL
jgi:hypothetical protein